MKTIIRNMMLGAILVSGLTVLQPSAMAQSATRTARTTQTTNNNSKNSARTSRPATKSSGAVAAPATKRSTVTRSDATVARPANNNRTTTTRGGMNNEQVSRPNNRNNNSSTANHWPTEGRPNNGTSNSNGYRPGNGTTVNRNNNHNVDPGFSVGGTRGDNNRGNNNGVSRPDNNRGNDNRGNGGYSVGRPANNGGHSNANIGRPGNWTRPVAPPVRQYRPEPRHWTRPVAPPRSFRPYRNAPIIGSVLGLSFGITYYNSLDYLYNRGYCIDGYQDGIVYLRDIREMYCYWPDAELYYDNGCLVRAQFSYSTNYGSTSRYNTLYQNLCGTYGRPVSVQRTGGGSVATWYGGDSRGYVTLEYQYMSGRWFTFLSYGY